MLLFDNNQFPSGNILQKAMLIMNLDKFRRKLSFRGKRFQNIFFLFSKIVEFLQKTFFHFEIDSICLKVFGRMF